RQLPIRITAEALAENTGLRGESADRDVAGGAASQFLTEGADEGRARNEFLPALWVCHFGPPPSRPASLLCAREAVRALTRRCDGCHTSARAAAVHWRRAETGRAGDRAVL